MLKADAGCEYKLRRDFPLVLDVDAQVVYGNRLRWPRRKVFLIKEGAVSVHDIGQILLFSIGGQSVPEVELKGCFWRQVHPGRFSVL